ncbi:hypothetical protein Leryth_023030 [Lithospermum erythrorhizon]|nr:hypothetical protein Leryth_023030 [Lithospermum erythrorhizon]
MISICITLWDEMTDSQGPLLMEVSNSRAVVVAKRLGFSTYNGRVKNDALLRNANDQSLSVSRQRGGRLNPDVHYG